jgi:hypothetical protein
MAVKSTQDIVQKWQQRMAGAGAAYTAGVNAVTESPMQKAAAALPKALANYTEAVTSGRMAAALNSVPIAFWKSQAAGGAGKLASGAAKGAPKMMKAIAALQPVWAAAKAAAQAAGDDPFARANAALAVMIAAKGAGKGY